MRLERDDLLERSVWDVFSEMAERKPDHPFIADTRAELTYRQVRESAELVSRGLATFGVTHGTRVITMLPTCNEWVVVAFALARLGALNVLANTRYTARELAHLISDSEPVLVVHPTSAFNRDYVSLVRDAMSLAVPDGKPPATFALDLDGDGVRPLENLADGQIPPPARVHGSEPLYAIYTSGTTGAPKGSLTKHGSAMFNAFHSGERQGFGDAERLLVFLPMFHCFGAVNALLNPMTHGGSLVMRPQFDPDAVLDTIEQEKITAIFGVPTNFIMIADAHRKRRAEGRRVPDLSTWKRGIIGGGNIPIELARYLEHDMGVNGLTNVYGMTETTACTTQTVAGEPMELLSQTAGRPLPGVEVKLRDQTDTGVGEIMVRGVTLHAGYLKSGGRADTSHLVDGWLPTGDLGSIDAEGRVSVVGRAKDMYKTSGFNVYPLEIENYLLTHPGVADVAVVGVPDPKKLEVGVAYVVRANDTVTEAELLEFAAKGLANFKVPARIIFVDELPRSQATLKVQKHRLKERWGSNPGGEQGAS